MKAKLLTLSAAVALTLGSVSASAVDFHGYARSGINYSSGGGSTYCLNKSLVGRLGNECDTYVEIGLGQTLYDKANTKFSVHTLLAFDTKGENWGDNTVDRQGNNWIDNRQGDFGAWGGIRTGMEELYADYEMPSGAKLWAGKRFYRRKDVHILDYYYLHNSGNGVGIDEIPVSNLGNVSVAILKSSTPTGYFGVHENINNYKLDLRWNDLPLWSDASMDAVLIYGWQNLSGVQKQDPNIRVNNSVLALLEWTQGNFFGGFNKLSFTYANNGFNTVGLGGLSGDTAATLAPYPTRGNSFRFIDWGLVEQSKWNLGYVLMVSHIHYKDQDHQGWAWNHGRNSNTWTFAIRPAYKWSDYTSTVLEYGYSSVPAANTKRESASKLTIAQQWSPSTTFWSRPSIRVFASWLSGDRMDHQNYTGFYKKNHEFIYGAQMEAWW